MARHSLLSSAICAASSVLANSWLRATRESSHLLSIVFHGLFMTDSEVHNGIVDPQQGITVEMLKTLVVHFLKHDYHFVTPGDLLSGLLAEGRYLLLTFDDGYYNNVRALPILEEFDIPAVFFISSGHVNNFKAYWWDVLYRKLAANGRNVAQIRRAQESFKCLTANQINERLSVDFGAQALKPVGDLDRPFTVSELRDFATHRSVFLGNHTRDHAILPNYSLQEIRNQIQAGQHDIHAMTGRLPQIIAYPNGDCSRQIAQVAEQLGLRIGVLAQSGRNLLPLSGASTDIMRLKRNAIWGGQGIEAQCQIVSSGLPLHKILRAFSAGTSFASAQQKAA